MMTKILRPVPLVLTLAMLGGCAGTVAPRPGDVHSYDDRLEPFDQLPRPRLGALPFFGPFTLYEHARVGELGTHTYQSDMVLGIDNERERGIVYTQRAGFLDIAHIRNSADMTAYVYARAKLAISMEWDEFAFKGKEPSTYRVLLCYPDEWERMDPDSRERVGKELAIRLAERIAFDVMTWHEILTWYGYKSTLVIPEKNSAFTYDDVPSHALGVQLAAAALRSGGDYDQEMTLGLDRALDELGAVDEEVESEVIQRVEDDWWTTLGGPKRRLLDIGLGDGIVEPWVVEGFSDGARHDFQLATLSDIEGHDFTGFYQLFIDPNVLEGFAIRDVIGEDREYIDPGVDFAVIINDIAQKLEMPAEDAIPDLAVEE
ncbi:MAG: DUF4056 domain-containing protein [Phycisphaerales bacterium]|nr:DUF4056 domain-containing protein [Phycisphaerales bacterium]